MQHSEHHYAILLYPVEDGIGKSRNNGAAYVAVHAREHLRVALDSFERRARGADETFAEALCLRFVVLESCSEIPADLPAENDRQRHLAPTRVRDHFIERNDVVRIALEICKALVEDGPMSVAHRNGRRIACQAFPDDFQEPHALLGR